MNHWIIIIPGWGTVYGIGTELEAKELLSLRGGRGRGDDTITPLPAASINDTVKWTNLTEYLNDNRPHGDWVR